MRKTCTATLCLFVFLYGCNTINPLKESLFNIPPYQKYIRSLKQAELDKTLMAKAWLRAGDNAMNDSVVVSLPFSESGYFKGSEPGARSYRFEVREGQVLTVNGAVVAKENANFFLDLFTWQNDKWVSLAHGDSALNLAYEFTQDYPQVLVRLQPELLISAYYTISMSLTPVLINPVGGATNKSIGSFYGDQRDGGKRSHEGVDIFARKGTPVIAPTDGYISRVGTSNLGGKIVWMQDIRRRHSYYFAHLDSQVVKTGTKVKQGDPIGTVGNTGNARYTPSHLHFGIYQSKSKDPIHYIRTLETAVTALPWDTTLTQPEFKVTAKSIAFRAGPAEKYLKTADLKKGTYLKVIAHSRDWYRVLLPNEKQGYVQKQKIAPIQNGKRERLKQPVVLLSEIHPQPVPLTKLKPETSIEVLAYFENYRYVRTGDGVFGWVMI
jgi:murein DD-endopeptidase MepM/ murein hydrolase activator NlpD